MLDIIEPKILSQTCSKSQNDKKNCDFNPFYTVDFHFENSKAMNIIKNKKKF